MTIHSVRSAVLLGVALVSMGCGRQESGPVPAAPSVRLTSGVSAAGIGVSKTCPTSAQAAGVPFNCSFTVANQDTANSVTGLSVTNTVPCPDPPACKGGSTAGVPCLVNGVPVTTLAPAGNPGSSCSGTLQESTPDCSVGSFADFVQASGNDGGQVGGGAAHSVPIAPCTRPPKNKPTK
jgi:hypothetical protein